MGADHAQVSLLRTTQRVVGHFGDSARAAFAETALEDSLCTVTALTDAPLIVEDARADERVNDLAPVLALEVGSYCGVPLRTPDGLVLGALCGYGRAPASFSEAAVALLEELGQAVVEELQDQTAAERYTAAVTRLDRLVGAASLGSWEVWLDTERIVWDARMFELYDIDPATFTNTLDAVFARIHPEDRATTRARFDRALALGIDYDAEYRVPQRDGSVRWIRTWGRVLSDGDRPERVVGSATDTVKVDDVLSIAQSVQQVTTPIFSLDDHDRFVFVNDEAARVMGIAPSELLGRPIWQYTPEAGVELYRSAFSQARFTNRPSTVERFDPLRNTWWETRVYPTPGTLTVHVADISGRKRDDQARAALLSHHRTIAEALESAVLPEALPELDGAELAALYRPADVDGKFGGDWYDAYVLDRHRLFLVVGDVAGHGLRAASVMGQLRNSLRAFTLLGKGPARVLWRLNELLHQLEPTAMATVWIGELDLRTGRLLWATAGHPPAVLAGGDETRVLERRPNPPIGAIRPGADYIEHEERLAVGDRLFLCTDGLIERRQEDLTLGVGRLVAAIEAAHRSPIGHAVPQLVREVLGRGTAADDVCVLAVEVRSLATPA